MLIESLYHTVNRRRPQEGWLSYLLLLVVVGIMIIAVLSVGWVQEDSVVVPAAILGLLMGAVLAKRPLPTWKAWTLITLYGLLITTLTLARLWPPLLLLFSDWSALRQHWLNNGALFLERSGSWITAVSVGGRSNETIVFAYLMGLLAWFLSAYAAWSAFRQRRPLLGLILMALVIAINGYYGAAPGEWAVAFVGIAVLTTAVLHFANLEFRWQKNRVDYSREIRLEMFAYAAGIGLALLAFSYLIPSINPSKLALAILGQPAVTKVEEVLDRSFGGIETARGRPTAPGLPGGGGIMPRAFLLGNAPELEKIVMMTAGAQVVDADQDAPISLARHWRALSYEIYTGRGWALSEETLEVVPAGDSIPLPPVKSSMVIEQDVHWRYDNRVIRYTLGLPLAFDHDIVAAWRGQSDLVRTKAETVNQYQASSRISTATPDELRNAALSDVPPLITYRYTQLPADLPQRVHDLALEVAEGTSNPYDQARAVERFLRQYDYSLEVELPPEGVDPVDFFLFDLQKGYCDYYASSMVVLARSLGLPARLATGFLAQSPDETGEQTIRQIDAHSWAEVYFAGYGWVEFEPTAPFLSPHDPLAQAVPGADEEQEPAFPQETTPIPEREPRRPFPWSRFGWLALLVVAIGTAYFWWSRRPKVANEVEWAYYHLQQNAGHLGHPLPTSQTPVEFSDDLLQRLKRYNGRPRLAKLVQTVGHPIRQLTNMFNLQQYSDQPPPEPQTAVSLWRRLRRPLWLLRLAKRLNL